LAAAITADGLLVIGAERGGLVVWDAATGDVIHVVNPLAGTVDAVQHVAATADGSLVLTGSYFGMLNLWDVTRGYHEFTEGELFTGNVRNVAFTASGRQAVVANSNGALFLNGDTRTGRDTLVLQGGDAGRSWVAASISADGARLVATGTDGAIAIYDQRGKRLHTLKAGASYLSFLTVGPDGRQLLAGGEDRTLRLWDLETRSNPRELTGHRDAIQAAAIAPDGVLAVSGSADDFGASPRMLLLWNLRDGKRVRTLRGHESSVYAVAFTADGRRVVSGGLDFSVRVWDARSGECLRVFEGHTDEVLGLAATSDGRSVVSGSRDQTVRLWDLESGECLAVAALPYVITTLALSGRELIVGGQAGNVRQFELRDPAEGTGRTTLGYRYDHTRRTWEPGPSALCPWCGWRLRESASVSAAIESIVLTLEPGQSPCLELPDEVFDEPALRSACTRCKATLVFNPFQLDPRSLW